MILGFWCCLHQGWMTTLILVLPTTSSIQTRERMSNARCNQWPLKPRARAVEQQKLFHPSRLLIVQAGPDFWRIFRQCRMGSPYGITLRRDQSWKLWILHSLYIQCNVSRQCSFPFLMSQHSHIHILLFSYSKLSFIYITYYVCTHPNIHLSFLHILLLTKRVFCFVCSFLFLFFSKSDPPKL